MLHVFAMKDHSHHLTKYEEKGEKNSIFKLFSELGKIWKCNLARLFQNSISFIHSPRPTFQNPNVESVDKLGKIMS